MTTTEAPLLSDEDRAAIATLLVDVDSVELKLTVPEGDQRSAVPTGADTSSVGESNVPGFLLPVAWLVVGIPLAYGIYKTVVTAFELF